MKRKVNAFQSIRPDLIVVDTLESSVGDYDVDKAVSYHLQQIFEKTLKMIIMNRDSCHLFTHDIGTLVSQLIECGWPLSITLKRYLLVRGPMLTQWKLDARYENSDPIVTAHLLEAYAMARQLMVEADSYTKLNNQAAN